MRNAFNMILELYSRNLCLGLVDNLIYLSFYFDGIRFVELDKDGYISLYFRIDMYGIKVICLPFIHLYFNQYLNWLDSGLNLVYESSYISYDFYINDTESTSLLLNNLDLSLLNKSLENEICMYISETSDIEKLNKFMHDLSHSFKSIKGFSNLNIYIFFRDMSMDNLSMLYSYFDCLDFGIRFRLSNI